MDKDMGRDMNIDMGMDMDINIDMDMGKNINMDLDREIDIDEIFIYRISDNSDKGVIQYRTKTECRYRL